VIFANICEIQEKLYLSPWNNEEITVQITKDHSSEPTTSGRNRKSCLITKTKNN